MSVMLVTGAFATHTTKLYNYYVCPRTWEINNVEYITVNYLGELNYLGQVVGNPIEWDFDFRNQIVNIERHLPLTCAIWNDLEQFKSLLKGSDHYLFLLSPIIGGCIHSNLIYHGNGPFTQSHRYFNSIGEMLARHQGLSTIPDRATDDMGYASAINDLDSPNQL